MLFSGDNKHLLGRRAGIVASFATMGAVLAPVGEAATGGTVYSDLIAPIMEERCNGCHGPEKQKGKLRLDSPEHILKGGDVGASIVVGKAKESELFYRLTVPLDDDDRMPPEGKPQLTDGQVEIIRWWINSGASFEQPVTTVPEKIRKLAGTVEAAAEVTNFASAEDVAAVRALGVLVNPLAQDSPLLRVECPSVAAAIGDAELAVIARLSPQIAWLDLARTSVTEAGLAALPAMPNLSRLHLGNTTIGDAALPTLVRHPRLESLNLYATPVSDAGLETLAKLPAVKNLFLYESAVTPRLAFALEGGKPGLEVDMGWQYQVYKNLGKSLVAYLPLEIDEPVKAGTDKATPTGGDFIFHDGPIGKAGEFQGGQAIRMGNIGLFDRETPFSIASWISPANSHTGSIVAKMDERDAFRGYDLMISGGRPAFLFVSRWPEDSLQIAAKNPLPAHRWSHVCLTYDGTSKASGVMIFVDGQPVDTEIANDALVGTTMNYKALTIGKRDPSQPFSGLLDDVRIYSRKLEPAGVRALFEQAEPERLAGLNQELQENVDYTEVAAKVGEAEAARFRFDGDFADARSRFPDGEVKGEAPFVEGRIGGGVKLNGETAVSLGNVANLDRTDPYAFTAWVFPEKADAACILSKMDSDNAYRGFDFTIYNSLLTAHLIHSWDKNAIKVGAKTPLPMKQWSHVAVTYTGSGKASGMRIYVNGVPQPLTVFADALTETTKTEQAFHIGQRKKDTAFAGVIDDVRMFRRALTVDEVAYIALGLETGELPQDEIAESSEAEVATAEAENPPVETAPVETAPEAAPVELVFDADSCCDKAHKSGEACKHGCCVKAAAANEVCAKCNPVAAAR